MSPEGSVKLKPGNIVDQIVAIRSQWHIKNHPFFHLMRDGKLELPALGVWLAQHYQWVRFGLRGFGLLMARAPDDVRRLLIENMAEEEGMMAGPGEGREPHNHDDLIFAFCNYVGMSNEDVLNIRPTPAWAAQGLNYLYCMEYEPVGVALAMASTQEGQQPELNDEVTIPAFIKHYGFTKTSPEIGFFVEHAVADADHSRRQLALTAKYCDSQEIKQRALDMSLRACQIRWATVTDVYRTEVLKDPAQLILPKGVAA